MPTPLCMCVCLSDYSGDMYTYVCLWIPENPSSVVPQEPCLGLAEQARQVVSSESPSLSPISSSKKTCIGHHDSLLNIGPGDGIHVASTLPIELSPHPLCHLKYLVLEYARQNMLII